MTPEKIYELFVHFEKKTNLLNHKLSQQEQKNVIYDNLVQEVAEYKKIHKEETINQQKKMEIMKERVTRLEMTIQKSNMNQKRRMIKRQQPKRRLNSNYTSSPKPCKIEVCAFDVPFDYVDVPESNKITSKYSIGENKAPRNCEDLRNLGNDINGFYLILAQDETISSRKIATVFCDFTLSKNINFGKNCIHLFYKSPK